MTLAKRLDAAERQAGLALCPHCGELLEPAAGQQDQEFQRLLRLPMEELLALHEQALNGPVQGGRRCPHCAQALGPGPESCLAGYTLEQLVQLPAQELLRLHRASLGRQLS